MQVQQLSYDKAWSDGQGNAQLVFLFGSPTSLENQEAMAELRERFPKAKLVGCSTAGEILGPHVSDDGLVATAVLFSDTPVQVASVNVNDGVSSEEVGKALAKKLPPADLKHVLVFSDGLAVNGSELVQGLLPSLPANVQVTGGLAGDGANFARTLVIDGDCSEHQVTAVGLYGEHVEVGYGSLGGWDSFGPMRKVTKSSANVLYELDGQPALELYKQYLGEQAQGLPATGLLFPLSVQVAGAEGEVTRTILAVDEEEQSLTFAGDIPEGSTARLMKANFDRLVEGAHGAALRSKTSENAELALLISCVGRKLVLKQRVEEEVEAVQEALGQNVAMTGFYSYGEICPAAPEANCELHNQTMTITTIREN